MFDTIGADFWPSELPHEAVSLCYNNQGLPTSGSPPTQTWNKYNLFIFNPYNCKIPTIFTDQFFRNHLKCSICKVLHCGPALEHSLELELILYINTMHKICSVQHLRATYLHPLVVVVYYCGNLGLLQHDFWNPHYKKKKEKEWKLSCEQCLGWYQIWMCNKEMFPYLHMF